MEPLPSPPPPPPATDGPIGTSDDLAAALPLPAPPPPVAARTPGPGELDGFFTTAFWIGWLGVAVGFGVVWYSARTLGFATWWLGPESQPKMFLVNLLPFVAPLSLCILGLLHRKWLPWFGVGGAVVCGLVALGDVGGVAHYWQAELLIAFGGLAISLASLAGMYRRPGAETQG